MTRDKIRIALVVSALVGLATVGTVYAASGSGVANATRAQYTPPAGGSGAVPPDLTAQVTASAANTPAVGAALNFYVTVKTLNRGGASATRLTLTLPDGWTYTSSFADRGPGCKGDAPTLTCDTAWINPSASTHVTLYGKVADASSPLVLQAKIASLQEPEADLSNNTTKLTISAAGTTTVTTGPPSKGSSKSSGTPKLQLKLVGSPFVGFTLHVAVKRGVKYQWQLCTRTCKPIRGATKARLKLVRLYVGHSIRVVAVSHGHKTTSKKLRIKIRVG